MVVGGDDGNSLYGDDSSAFVSSATPGSSNNDTLIGGAGNDLIFGGGGQDLIEGRQGKDTLYGGDGDDTLLGQQGSNTIVGDAGQDSLVGDQGSDFLDGGTGDDRIYGGEGSDDMRGGDGQDRMEGDIGDDTLIGGTGADQMYGGNDRDLFIINPDDIGSGDFADGGTGGDDVDTLDLSGVGRWRIVDETTDADGDSTSGTVQFLDSSGGVSGSMTFTEIESIVCFAAGTLITTDCGPVPVERIVPDARVLTRDNGFQTVRWAGRRDLTVADLARHPAFAAVRIAGGALGNGLPLRDLIVSPQHRMLWTGPRAEMCFGEREVLVGAIHLVGRPGITRLIGTPVSYLHILCDRHEIVQAEASWTESFQPGDYALRWMADAARKELQMLFPGLDKPGAFPAARLTLKGHEARVLRAA